MAGRIGNLVTVWSVLLACAAQTSAQTPAAPVLNLTASTDNVSSRDSIRINLFRWSTDAERDQMLAAWNLTTPPTPAGRGGRAAGAQRSGAGLFDPAAGGPAPAGASPAPGRGGRGGRGGAAGTSPAPRLTPELSLKAALDKAPTVGYLWSSEVTGYALRYAVRLPQPDGGARILLLTDRRLGAWNNSWKLATADTGAPDYEFSLIELRLNSKGEGEGKISLAGRVAVDSGAKVIALENYASLPVILKNVKTIK